MKKKIKCMFMFLLGGIFGTISCVYAAATIASSDVQYTPNDSTWSVDNVETAISELESMTAPLMEEMCPGCVYAFPTSEWKYGTNGEILTSDQYKTRWSEVIKSTGKKVFAGLILDSSKRITRAFMCGIKDGVPFCLEGAASETEVSPANLKIANNSLLYDHSCYLVGVVYHCGVHSDSTIDVLWDAGGAVKNGDSSSCVVNHTGTVMCK